MARRFHNRLPGPDIATRSIRGRNRATTDPRAAIDHRSARFAGAWVGYLARGLLISLGFVVAPQPPERRRADCLWIIPAARAGPLAARSRGSETESTDRRRAHHSRPKAAKTSNCLIRTPFLRHLSRRVVRVEIAQKPGVVRGTGSSNPSPSSGESAANSVIAVGTPITGRPPHR